LRVHPPAREGLKWVLRVLPDGWEVPQDSFFQNNFFALPVLVETVRTAIRQSSTRFLVDAFCGVGFFSLGMANLIESFIGVEFDKAAIAAARRNAAARNASNGQFIVGRAEKILPTVLSRLPSSKTVVLLDPPRTGCPEACLETLLRF